MILVISTKKKNIYIYIVVVGFGSDPPFMVKSQLKKITLPLQLVCSLFSMNHWYVQKNGKETLLTLPD